MKVFPPCLPPIFLFIERQFIRAKAARRKGTRMHCQPFLTPTYLPPFSVYSSQKQALKKKKKISEWARTRSDIKMPEKIFPHRLKQMLNTPGQRKDQKVSGGLFRTLTLCSTSHAPLQSGTLRSNTMSKMLYCQLCLTVTTAMQLPIRSIHTKSIYTLQYRLI